MADGDLSVRVASTGRDEIGALGADFNPMAERLNELLQAQRRLVRDVSHELRSPLARLRIALELAERSNDPGKAIKRIEKEADELERLTTEVLSLARLDAGQAGFEGRPLRLDELVARIVTDADFEARASARSIRFSPQPIPVVGDAALLRSAVENVLRNAIRYTPEGGEVSVTMGCDNAVAVVQVCDAGPGLEESQLQAVFDPFSRAADSRDRDSGGFGLGLAIARRAMRLHGGDIDAHNRPEGGLEVRLHLPLPGQ
jgi:two-component system sensor histidine kinase CpxA